MGSAHVIIGGPRSRKLKVQHGDVIILPAGVGHKCVKYSDDFMCVGAYPQGKDYDIKLGIADEYPKAVLQISKLILPDKDPVYGKEGFLKAFWKHS